MRQFLFTAMAFATCGLSGSLTDDVPSLRASAFVSEAKDVSPSRKGSPGEGQSATSSAIDKVFGFMGTARTVRLQILCIILLCCIALTTVCFMYQPQQGGASSLRLPPRWDPSMEGSMPFRSWMQDLMLWTICTDLNPAQQCAAIISQLGGAARELARTLTPAEVYQGGIINGQQLDPVSFLLHGLQVRFAPLDEENRLRAAQDLLSFSRRSGESVDTLISRFEITRQRARDEGGGAVDDWAYAAMSRDPAASDTESATSSDNDEALPVDDLSGLAPAEVDERTLRKKGKGKGKGKRSSFLNIGLHFAAFESDGSWANVLTPRSTDPWMQWYQEDPLYAQPSAQAQQAVQSETRSTWTIPGIGNVGVSQSFSE
ncbi:NPF8.5, partial [Symbiodinium necroappetens]